MPETGNERKRGVVRDAPSREALLTPAECCEWLDISKSQLYRLNLPTIRLGERTVRYSVEQVLEHLKRTAA